LHGINFLFGVGGNKKKNSSSWILKEWQNPSTKRTWGKFYNLFEDNFVKIKELVILPNQGMSFQRHFYRSELWLVSKGRCVINFSHADPSDVVKQTLNKGDRFDVHLKKWHQITNPFSAECRIIEIQYGDKTIEDDIERLYYYEDSK
jgi:mannose-6-phosphate isomerase-like protein (cupin superfamily)